MLTRCGYGVEADEPVETFGSPRGHPGPTERHETAFAAFHALRDVLFRYIPIVQVHYSKTKILPSTTQCHFIDGWVGDYNIAAVVDSDGVKYSR